MVISNPRKTPTAKEGRFMKDVRDYTGKEGEKIKRGKETKGPRETRGKKKKKTHQREDPSISRRRAALDDKVDNLNQPTRPG